MQFNMLVVDRSHLGLTQFEATPRLKTRSRTCRQILVRKDLPQRLCVDLSAVSVGVALNNSRKLDLQAARQLQVVCPRHKVGNPALTGLGIYAYNGLVRATDIVGVDRQVGKLPNHCVLIAPCGVHLRLTGGKALLDGVLVRAREAGVHQISDVGRSRRSLHLGAVLHGAADLVDVREVDARINSLAEKIQAQGQQVNVTGTFALSQEAAFDAVCAGEECKFSTGDTCSTIIVRVNRQRNVLASGKVTRHVLDLVGENIGGRAFNGRGQVEDDLAAFLWLPDVHNGFAHFQCEITLGINKNFG